MKFLKIIIFITFITVFMVIKPIHAQTPSPVPTTPINDFLRLMSPNISNSVYNPNLPGIGCGNANAQDETKRCCYYDSIVGKKAFTRTDNWPTFGPVNTGEIANNLQSFFIDVLQLIPGVPDIFQKQNKEAALKSACVIGEPNTSRDNTDMANCLCVSTEDKPTPVYLCNKYLAGKKEYGACVGCAGGGGIWSAMGCIYMNDMSTFFQKNVFGLGIGLAGTVSLLCIIYSAFMMQTSRGNPEKIKKAQEMLTSCIMGLMLIIFSVFILRLIGVQILKIPGMN